MVEINAPHKYTNVMKAIVIKEFGGPEKMHFAEVPTPKPAADEILLQIAYAGVNPVDWKIREGHLRGHLPHQLPIILGWDAAGTVGTVGEKVTKFRTGDKVYAYCRKPIVSQGTYAEFITLKEDDVAFAPANLSLAQAAGVPLTALTAWQALFDVAKIQPQEKILIHAGAGGVGGWAIQMAKTSGARVFTTASQKNHQYVTSLGADVVIDYTERSFVEAVKEISPTGLDFIFDCVGGKTLEQSYPLLKSGGRLVSIVETPVASMADHPIEASYLFVTPNGAQLTQITQWLDSGRLKPLEVQELPWEKVTTAHATNQARHVRGKIVLKIT